MSVLVGGAWTFVDYAESMYCKKEHLEGAHDRDFSDDKEISVYANLVRVTYALALKSLIAQISPTTYPAILQARGMYTVYYTKPMNSIKHERNLIVRVDSRLEKLHFNIFGIAGNKTKDPTRTGDFEYQAAPNYFALWQARSLALFQLSTAVTKSADKSRKGSPY
ncbi:hypothetical protein EV421DRAFT_1746314 [Armillaria borealis]|uniref:Uncharacterized protein n=1 Tax=Armillaria borealis TaxID=47425 RepID=A0AA39IC81_9AGAR|nr:hypothetical protein EV421DRAFT_1746314 [Armillaria borealis]